MTKLETLDPTYNGRQAEQLEKTLGPALLFARETEATRLWEVARRAA